MMDAKKRPFRWRALVAVTAAFTGLGLPISGLILHAHSDRRIMVGRHGWLMTHVLLGSLFMVSVAWHVVLNRRSLLSYLKSEASGSLPLSREAHWAIIIIAALVVMMIHAF